MNSMCNIVSNRISPVSNKWKCVSFDLELPTVYQYYISFLLGLLIHVLLMDGLRMNILGSK